MSRPRRPADRRRILQSVEEIVIRVDGRLPTVIARLREWSGGITVGSGPSAKGTHSDPTAAAALATDEHNLTRQRIDQLLEEIWGRARELDNICRQVMTPPLTAEEAVKQRENQRAGTLQPCANIHGCPDEAWAVRAGRCESCDKYRRRKGQDRRVSGAPRG